MQIPILTKRQDRRTKAIEDKAIATALTAFTKTINEGGTVEKGFLTGNAVGTSVGPAGQMNTSWNNGGPGNSQGPQSNALAARLTQNLAGGFGKAPDELEAALAEQGLTWGPPFPPGKPLDPFYGYRRPARTWDYSVGENVQLTPRWKRISFPTIKSIYESYDVAQICVRHLINDVRSLEYNWEPIPGIKADVSGDIEQAIAFFDSPDKRQPFRLWLAEFLQDVLRYDAGALYIRRNEIGEPIALEVIDGTTIIPLVDYYGRRPEDETDKEDSEGLFEGEIVPAYTQIIEGMPWDWLVADDMIYLPWNPLPNSQYGQAPLEAVLLSANTDIRFQWHFLQYFTEGSMTAGFMEAPPDQSDPAQLAQWQEVWDAVMLGDQSKLSQIRWVPNGAKFTPSKPSADTFNSEFPLYLMRRTCAAYGITPNDLGFTENVNRATGDTQVDVQFRVGTSPLLRYCEDVINIFVKQYLGLRCRIHFDDGKETEDRVATAQADGIYMDHGVKGPDEVRQDLGLHVDKSRPMPRYINNARSGPIPLLALESMAGKIDAETYGPSDAQKPVDTPFSPAPGPIPPQGSAEQKLATEHTAQNARDLVAASQGDDVSATEDTPSEESAEDVTEKAVSWDSVFSLLDSITKDGATAGVTAATGVQGSDLIGDESDDDDDEESEEIAKAAQVALSLRRWRDNSRNRVKKGQPPKQFVDPELPAALKNEVWTRLQKASTRVEVDAVFTDLAKAGSASPKKKLADAAKFHRNSDAIVAHYAPLIAKALGQTFSQSDIDKAVKAAYGIVEKSEGPPPNLRQSETLAKRCDSCCLATNPVCVKYGGWQVEPDQVCDGWAQAAITKSAQSDAVRKVLAIIKGKPQALSSILRALYGDAFLQGSYDAAQAAGAKATKARRWEPKNVDAQGRYHVYHGTNADGAKQIRDTGLKTPDGQGPSWKMVTTDPKQAKSYAKGVSGNDVLHYAIPAEDAPRYLTAPEAHDVYGRTADVHGLRTGELPSKYLVDSSSAPPISGLEQIIDDMPADYWNNWKPGYGDAAAQAADGKMAEALDKLDMTIKDTTETTIDRIGNRIAEGLEKGDSIQTVGKEIREDIEDPARAEMIANTETARASTTASEQTYEQAGVGTVEWIAEDDACEECLSFENDNPYEIEDTPDLPAHPNCRCALAPVVEGDTETETETSE